MILLGSQPINSQSNVCVEQVHVRRGGQHVLRNIRAALNSTSRWTQQFTRAADVADLTCLWGAVQTRFRFLAIIMHCPVDPVKARRFRFPGEGAGTAHAR